MSPGFPRAFRVSSRNFGCQLRPSTDRITTESADPMTPPDRNRIYYGLRFGPTRQMDLLATKSYRNTFGDSHTERGSYASTVNLHDFEEKVRRLPGVEAARVVSEGGVVTEVQC